MVAKVKLFVLLSEKIVNTLVNTYYYADKNFDITLNVLHPMALLAEK